MVGLLVLGCLPVVGEGKTHNKAAASCWPDVEGQNESALVCFLSNYTP